MGLRHPHASILPPAILVPTALSLHRVATGEIHTRNRPVQRSLRCCDLEDCCDGAGEQQGHRYQGVNTCLRNRRAVWGFRLFRGIRAITLRHVVRDACMLAEIDSRQLVVGFPLAVGGPYLRDGGHSSVALAEVGTQLHHAASCIYLSTSRSPLVSAWRGVSSRLQHLAECDVADIFEDLLESQRCAGGLLGPPNAERLTTVYPPVFDGLKTGAALVRAFHVVVLLGDDPEPSAFPVPIHHLPADPKLADARRTPRLLPTKAIGTGLAAFLSFAYWFRHTPIGRAGTFTVVLVASNGYGCLLVTTSTGRKIVELDPARSVEIRALVFTYTSALSASFCLPRRRISTLRRSSHTTSAIFVSTLLGHLGEDVSDVPTPHATHIETALRRASALLVPSLSDASAFTFAAHFSLRAMGVAALLGRRNGVALLWRLATAHWSRRCRIARLYDADGQEHLFTFGYCAAHTPCTSTFA
uniref:Uncharacterized protein n=1 Tax=Mycena chlorophos TaxID=658473 RepID=A0ABQ0LEL8_MYCCL|nr:predicted protein [Mycena chlorophos]